MEKREKFSSNLGFLLISAGCAIGLGNVWRFPYIVGQYGGAAFVIIYLFFLIVLGLPILVMEFAIGRASGQSIATAYKILEPKGTKWHLHSYFAMAGNYLLMMFYTTVAGWMLIYLFYMIRGDFVGITPVEVEAIFSNLISNPSVLLIGMLLVTFIGFGVCALGVQKGVEKITKYMMSSLFIVMIVLAVRAVTLDNAELGLSFYLMPDFSKIKEAGILNVLSAAMAQAFFTLSLGIGSMTIFGSYINKNKSLTGESIKITVIDTLVAIVSGLIIFPACFAFGVNPGSGPGLVFITLPNIFNEMIGSRFWGILFFVFMSFAALSTIIAVFENLVAFLMDMFKFTRKKSVVINLIIVIIISVPCLLGFNLWSDFQPLGANTNIMDLEDFLVSKNLLVLGALVILLFCTKRYGWGYKKFLKEADEGNGIKFPKWIGFYLKFVLPFIIIFIFIQGYMEIF